MLTLTLKEKSMVPLEAESISPDVFAGKSLEQVCALPVYLGKRQLRIDECFHVSGSVDDSVEIHGDCAKVKHLGRAMTKGSLRIVGNAGMHLGAQMKGGTIEVTGNASDWIGAEMTGGTIRVHGNAGGQIGAAYRGSLSGMNGGTILIGGNAGLEVGMRMKRGIIAIKGKTRDFAGLQMKGGTLILGDGAEVRTGAWMTRGTIIALKPLKLMPTFAFSCKYDPTFLRLYAKSPAKLGFDLPIAAATGCYGRYLGDASVPGKGEILVWEGAH